MHLIPRPVIAAAGLVLGACATTGKDDSSRGPHPSDPRPIAEIVEATRQPTPIGKFLSDLDASIRAWNNLLISAGTEDERKRARLLETNLMAAAHHRRSELIEQLETGPPSNRMIAACALGFTRDAEAQSPLLAALEDADPEVVGNALIGLMLLGRADTPLDPMCRLLETGSGADVRRNAAQCLAALVQAGARADCVLPVARVALADVDAGIRSQCALILGGMVDAQSLDALLDRLHDPVPLVSAASARAVAHIGRNSPADRGRAGRALFEAFRDLRGAVRNHMRRSLMELAGVDLGKEPKDWEEWVRRLP